MYSYAQNFEDVMLARLFSGQDKGFYVDVGAAHPEDLSVTKHFYDNGWRGINIDPIPSVYRLFESSRPDDININCAVGTQGGSIEFFEVEDNTALSTLKAHRADELKANASHKVTSYEVPVRTLNEILDIHAGGRNIDFLKIDVEGAEDEVLRSIDLQKWQPKVMVVEAVVPIDNFPGWAHFEPDALNNSASWENIVASSDYDFVHFDGLNRFYIHRSVAFLGKRLSTPPGVFDFIIPDMIQAITDRSKPKQQTVGELLRAEIIGQSEQYNTDDAKRGVVYSEFRKVSERLDKIEKSISAALSNTSGSTAAISSDVQNVAPTAIDSALLTVVAPLQKALEEKEAFIQKQAKELSALARQSDSRGGFIGRLMRRGKAIIRPRLGNLNQHGPVELLLPSDYSKPIELDATPTISIVTPSFNQGVFLARTLDSVLDQNYPSLQFFVQDGGSTDTTVNVLKQYENRLSGWESAPDGGQSNAINKGFVQTSGEIMAWLNSDDVLMPGALHYVADYFNRNPDVDVVYGHRILIDENDKMIGRWIMPAHEDNILSWADYIPQETMFWRREIWERAGGQIDESFRFAMDWDLILRFRANNAKFARLPRVLGGFRIHEKQKTSAAISQIGYEEMDRLRARVLGRVPSYLEIHRAMVPYLIKHVVSDVMWRVKRRKHSFK